MMDLDFFAVDDGDARDRPAFAKDLVDEHDEQRPEVAADDPSAAAQDRGATDNDRRNHNELGAEAGLGGDAFVLGDGHQPSGGCAQG